MLNKTFAFSNAVSHRLFKNKNKNIRFLMEEILGNEKLKTCISQDSQEADSARHAAMTDVSDLFIGFQTFYFRRIEVFTKFVLFSNSLV